MPKPRQDYPELPPLRHDDTDVILEAFSHKSLDLHYDPENAKDNLRLVEVGKSILQFAITYRLYTARPIIEAEEIPARRESELAFVSEQLMGWVEHYNLRQKLRYHWSNELDLLSQEETANLFHAYLGAVARQSGPAVANNWILRLLGSNAKDLFPESQPSSDTQLVHKAPKRARKEPQQPKEEAPPIPAERPPPQTTTASNGVTALVPPQIGTQAALPKAPVYLSQFNQRCSQQHLKLEYSVENVRSETPHAPLWMTVCSVNGVEKGRGQGPSKQIAKEAAAKQAFFNMGWGGYGFSS